MARSTQRPARIDKAAVAAPFGEVIEVIAPLWIWRGGSWHFITIPAEDAVAIRAHSLLNRGGFGSVKVEATIHDVTWRTSVFPQKSGGYLLPVKADVRRRADIAVGDEVTVRLELL
jgi:hypothetical protein